MNWKSVELGDICDISNGSTPLRTNNNFWDNGTVSWFTIEDIRKFGRVINQTSQFVTEKAVKETSLKIVPVNTVLICCTASVGEYAITKIPLAMNQQFNGLILKTDEVIPEFLYHFCSTIKEKLISLSGSTTINFVAISKLKRLKISYPSLPVQKKLVTKLDALLIEIDKATRTAEINVKNAEALFQSYLTRIYEGENQGWDKKKISEIAEIKGGKRVPKGMELIREKTPYPYLRVTNFSENGDIDTTDLRYADYEIFNQIKRYIITSNDLYISIAGTIGRTGIVSNELSGSLLTENACRLVFDKEISNKFVYFFTKSSNFINQTVEQTRTTAQPKLALSRLGEITLAIPSLDEQLRVVKNLELLSNNILLCKSYYISKVKELSKLKQSILQSAFAGELVKE